MPEVKTIHELAEMLKFGREMEHKSALQYNKWANECGANADSVSKTLFESLVADEERRFDQYDTELENIDKFVKGIWPFSPSNEAGAARQAGPLSRRQVGR